MGGGKTALVIAGRWSYLAALIALVPFLPFIIWNIQNNFAHLEFMRHATQWKYVLSAAVALSGLVFLPPAIPILPVRAYIGYTKALGITQKSVEAHQLADLPQSYADRFGWEELTKTVSAAYQIVPENERPKTIVYAHNYGEAGAIDYYRGKYDLPPVVCPHNSYWFWGRAYIKKDIEVIIIIGGTIEDHLHSLQDVRQVAVHRCQYRMPYENNLPIFIGKKLKRPFSEIWATDKRFI